MNLSKFNVKIDERKKGGLESPADWNTLHDPTTCVWRGIISCFNLFLNFFLTGSFYLKYPRHRKLISINKRNTGKTNKEFNMRHDWNSLLSHDDSLLIRHYSKELFPHADILVRYLNDYKEKLGIQVQYNTNIRNIERHEHLYTMEDGSGQKYTCS